MKIKANIMKSYYLALNTDQYELSKNILMESNATTLV